jgi:hypothetical protein
VTLRKPDGMGVLEWLMQDVSLKTIVCVAVLLIGHYFATISRITIVEQSAPTMKADLERTQLQLDELRKESVSKEDLAAEERGINAQLAAQQESLNRIEGYLMERKSIQ